MNLYNIELKISKLFNYCVIAESIDDAKEIFKDVFRNYYDFISSVKLIRNNVIVIGRREI